jgi:hypothetical protein
MNLEETIAGEQWAALTDQQVLPFRCKQKTGPPTAD